jgi:hypothetical protein
MNYPSARPAELARIDRNEQFVTYRPRFHSIDWTRTPAAALATGSITAMSLVRGVVRTTAGMVLCDPQPATHFPLGGITSVPRLPMRPELVSL